jgi:hypothetical protein
MAKILRDPRLIVEQRVALPDLAPLERAGIARLLELGREQDVNKGGYCDARSGCVNFCCGPEDKPEGWGVPITCGGYNFPREYVAGLYWEWQKRDGAASIWGDFHLVVTPYKMLRHYQRTGLTDAQWQGCVAWSEAKARALYRLAAERPKVLGTRCPYCAFVLPTGHLLNTLIDHINNAHEGIKIEGVHLSEPACLVIAGVGKVSLLDATEWESK